MASQPVPAQNPSVVTLTGGVPTTTSLAIADGSEIQHKNVLGLVRRHQTDLEEFGPIAFETRKGSALPQGGFTKPTEVAILNEQQAALLFTYMKNTAPVRAFKKRLVREFYALAQAQIQPKFRVKERLEEPRILPPVPAPVRSRVLLTLEDGVVVKSETLPENMVVIDSQWLDACFVGVSSFLKCARERLDEARGAGWGV